MGRLTRLTRLNIITFLTSIRLSCIDIDTRHIVILSTAVFKRVLKYTIKRERILARRLLVDTLGVCVFLSWCCLGQGATALH